MSRQISTIVTGMSYLEGPRWHDQRIWFSDFYTCRVYSAAEDGSDIRTEAEVPGQPSGLGWLPDGRLLIVSMRDGRLLRREADGTLVCHADLSGYINGHLNDMVVDSHGRAFVGEFGFDLMGGADLKPAGLLRVDPDGTVTKVAEDLWFPNGSVITEDGTLLVDETFGNRVTAFDITEDGTLANRRTWAKFGELAERQRAREDAHPGRRRPRRLRPGRGRGAVDSRRPRRPGHPGAPGGEITEEIQAGTGVFACMLGGADGRTLFICTAPDFQEEARKNAREASLVTARVDTPRAGLP